MIYRSYIKRMLDIIFSLLGLIIFTLLYLPVAISIKLDDRGTIFYNATRLGKDMKEFKMYKFRTMKENAPDIRNPDGTTFNSNDDPRLTRVGKVLRKTSLDELPQFLNVLKGDMSLIGPRPSPLGDKSQYPKDFFKKYKVRPGITGYNQATLRNTASMNDRIQNDSYYVDNISFKLDLKILIWTFKSVLKSENIYNS